MALRCGIELSNSEGIVVVYRSVVSNSLRPLGLQPARLLCLCSFPGKNSGVGCYFLLQPTRLPRPWDSPGKNTGVGCHCLLQCMKVKSESEVAQSCPTLVTPQTAAYQAPPSMGFSRQEYWSGVPLPHTDSDTTETTSQQQQQQQQQQQCIDIKRV